MTQERTTADAELGATGQIVETMIPRRLDRLPWSRWHWLVVIGLGITWILDGFEVTVVGAIASVLTHPNTLHLSAQQSASAGTSYLFGAIAGALFFGYLTDRIGRKRLFMVTLSIYLAFTVAWLHQYRRLRIRYERRDDIHEAFLAIGCSLICLKLLQAKESF